MTTLAFFFPLFLAFSSFFCSSCEVKMICQHCVKKENRRGKSRRNFCGLPTPPTSRPTKLESRMWCDFLPATGAHHKTQQLLLRRRKKSGKKFMERRSSAPYEIFSFWEGVDDFWSLSNSRRHQCNRKAICPYRICYVISQNWASFFDDGKCVKIASASFLVIGNGTPSFHFLDPATADG